MACDCETLLGKKDFDYPYNKEISKRLEYLLQGEYREGMVCGEFEATYWYQCKKCDSIYAHHIMDGDHFDFWKYQGDDSPEEFIKYLKEEYPEEE